MSTILYASQKTTDYSHDFLKNLALATLDTVESYLDNCEKVNIKNTIADIKLALRLAFNDTNPCSLKATQIHFGQDKYGYIVHLSMILDEMYKNEDLKQILQNEPEIKLAIYHDELTLVNPIGISIHY